MALVAPQMENETNQGGLIHLTDKSVIFITSRV